MQYGSSSSWGIRALLCLLGGSLLLACANVGSIEGGPYDMTPPRLVGAHPAQRQVEVSDKRLRLTFDEYIKLSQQDKIVVSPPQVKPPVIAAVGKSIDIRLEEDLRPNTTYSIYFDDAIADNNEDNVLADFAYTFSTGKTLDTMRIAGIVLDAETLEPVANLLIGAYPASSFADSLLLDTIAPYASKTNKLGRFTMRGLPDSTYRIFAIQDTDNDYRLARNFSEGVALNSMIWRTTKLDSLRTDTIRIDSIVRRDTLHRDSLVTYDYTYYKPDGVVLRYFTPRQKRLGIDRTSRADSLVCRIDFLSPVDTVPELRSLDRPELSAEQLYLATLDATGASYWLRDSGLIGMDSIRFAIEYAKTDSAMRVERVTDTLTFHRPRQRGSAAKGGDSLALTLSFRGAEAALSETLRDSLILKSSLPLLPIATEAIRLEGAADSTFTPLPYRMQQVRGEGLQYALLFERSYGHRYRVQIDSAAVQSIYGQVSPEVSYEQKTLPEADLGRLEVQIFIDEQRPMIAQLLDKSGAALLSMPLVQDSTVTAGEPAVTDPMLSQILSRSAQRTDSTAADTTAKAFRVAFENVKMGDYYLRLYVDANGDGTWTTGAYPDRYPEEMYYSPTLYAVKKGFQTMETWHPRALTLDLQKPEALRKVKPEQKKPAVDKNIEYYRKHPPKAKKEKPASGK